MDVGVDFKKVYDEAFDKYKEENIAVLEEFKDSVASYIDFQYVCHLAAVKEVESYMVNMNKSLLVDAISDKILKTVPSAESIIQEFYNEMG